ncbi:DUF3768 domain-containing protein [Aureimonas psammosilenae]|uniref:DUF3768 domain-containing protein n=1 Tax=Aureimonas psammosilenae TaxID=2495496 RepID=UPI001260CC8E|nr:DUF3768 domain-containing protein [Aureimonas psammosilenae]
MSAPKTIAELNDAFRRTFTGGHVLLTPGLASLRDRDIELITTCVQLFDGFTPEMDPYGEHDFGSFDKAGVGKIFWKIDYYDPAMQYHSENAADPAKTTRVLTIMLASEY